jgi:hypothetical protein
VFAEWTKVNETDDTFEYANLATIRQHGDTAKMWSLRDFKVVREVEQVRYLSSEGQYEYNCTEEQFRNIIFTWYSDNMGSGNEVHTDSSGSNWKPVRPGSVIETLLKIACGIK